MERIDLIGELTQDAQEKTNGNKTYLHFDIWIKDQKDKDKVRYYTCFLYGNYANRQKYLLKGAKVFVSGKFVPSIYQDENKEPKLNLSVNVTEINLI